MNSFDKIVNPVTGKNVNINGKLGKKILENYKNITKINNKLDYNQTGGAHQLQRMIAALLVEGGLTSFQNWKAGRDSHKDFNHANRTAHYAVHDDQGTHMIAVRTRRTQAEPFNYTSYSGRAPTHSYSQRRQVIQKIKHSGDIHIDNKEDDELLENNSLFYHYDPTNTFSTTAQAYLDDFIIDYVLNVHGTDSNSPHYTEFMNIFSLRHLHHALPPYQQTYPLFFTSRYKAADAKTLSILNTTELRYLHGHKKASVARLRLGQNALQTLANFPAAHKIYSKYNATMPGYETLRWVPTGANVGQPLTLEEYNDVPFVDVYGDPMIYTAQAYAQTYATLNFRSWIQFLINTRSNTHQAPFDDQNYEFTKAWVAEDIVREIYLQSIFDALINLSDYKKRRTWNPYYTHPVDNIVKNWNTGERGADEQVPVRTYKYINGAVKVPEQMTTTPHQAQDGAILMNFNEFKTEYLHFNQGRDPNAQGIANDEKTRRRDLINKNWAKTIGINKRHILFNQIYAFPTNHHVNEKRRGAASALRTNLEYFPAHEQQAFVTRSHSYGQTPVRQAQGRGGPGRGRGRGRGRGGPGRGRG